MNYAYYFCDTSLILASRCGHIQCVNLLVEAGADVNRVSNLANNENCTVLSFTAYYNLDPYYKEGKSSSELDKIS